MEVRGLALSLTGLKEAVLITETSSLTADLDFFPRNSRAEMDRASVELIHFTLDSTC